MRTEEFNTMLENRLIRTKSILDGKSAEYSTGADKLHNFKKAILFNALIKNAGDTQERSLWGMLAKHIVSISDMVESEDKYTHEIINEQIGDTINYLILLEAMLKERNCNE